MKSLLYLIKSGSETVEKGKKERKGGFVGMLVATLASSLLENILEGKGVIWAGEEGITTSQGQITIREGEQTIRAGQDIECRIIL